MSITRFTGRVALVTGGAGGIGAATCRRLAAVFDAADEASVQRLVDTTAARHGRLDILFNNAALLGPQAMADGPVAALDLAVFDRLMAINLRGYVAGCKHALRHMCAAGRGAIVNTTSVQGLAGDVRLSTYAISKAAIIGLTRSVATRYGVHGVRCNAIAPGLIVTPAVAALPPDFADAVRPHVLVDQLGTPEDIANLVGFLASDEAGYITGQIYACDGGLRAHLPNSTGGAPNPSAATA